MYKIGIITDSASDLTNELYKKNNIEIIPYSITINGKTFLADVNLKTEELFKDIDETKQIPKTSQITPAMFMEYFENYLEKYEDIIYIGLSSGFSGTYNNSSLAAREIDINRIHVIDSKNLSSGIGLLVLKACKLRDEGKSVDDVVNEVERCVGLVRTQFAINTLTYLHLGGRCSGTSRIFGTFLKIKPIIKVVNGSMVVAKKPIGNYRKALDIILDMVRDDKDNIDQDNVMVTHCLASDDAIYLKEELKKMSLKANILETYAGAIVSSHCGPRTIGILYILKK